MVNFSPWKIFTDTSYENNSVSDNAHATFGDSIDVYNISEQTREQSFFSVVNYEQHKDRISRRVPGTCRWALEHELFKLWLLNPQDSILWITAYPGCGKSVLSKSLVEERGRLLDKICPASAEYTVIYFFFKDNRRQRSVTTALCSLLHQIFKIRLQLFKKHGKPALMEGGERLRSDFQALWRLFIKTATDPETGPIVCVLDGLDECGVEDRRAFLNKLRNTFDNQSTRSNAECKLRFFITSRPYPEIECKLEKMSSRFLFRIRGEEHSQPLCEDINRVAAKKIQSLSRKKGFTPSLKAKVLKKVFDNEQRNCLWITLLCRELQEQNHICENDWLAALEKIPRTVEKQYALFLDRSSNASQALTILKIVIGARRPLTLQELSVALAIHSSIQSGSSFDDLQPLSEEAMRNALSSLCGFLLVIYDGKVLLSHYTVFTFLMQPDEAAPHTCPIEKWKHSLKQQECHRALAEISMRALIISRKAESPSLGEHATISARNRKPSNRGLEHIANNAVIQRIFDYAASYWSMHFRLARYAIDEPLTELAMQLCNVNTDCYRRWFRVYWWRFSGQTNKTGDFTDLGLATFLGLETIVKRLLRNGSDVNGNCGGFGFALYIAAWMGSVDMVKLLLKEGADINKVNNIYGNPLYAALTNRRSVEEASSDADPAFDEVQSNNDVVFLLLKHKADVNTRGGLYGTVLQSAAVRGDDEVVQALLDSGAEVNATCTTQEALYTDALSAAAWNGHQSTVEKLLEHGAVIMSDQFGSPLYAACFINNGRLVRLFLEKSGDLINNHGGELGYPLQAAAWKGDVAMVQDLLDHEADIDAVGGYFGTALQAASFRGEETVVELLLRNGARQLSCGEYGSPSKAAEASGNGRVRAILDRYEMVES